MYLLYLLGYLWLVLELIFPQGVRFMLSEVEVEVWFCMISRITILAWEMCTGKL